MKITFTCSLCGEKFCLNGKATIFEAQFAHLKDKHPDEFKKQLEQSEMLKLFMQTEVYPILETYRYFGEQDLLIDAIKKEL